jgi:glutamine synthetase
MLCAGIDGIKNQIEPGEPLDVDIYELSPEELSKIPSTPGSLEAGSRKSRKRLRFLDRFWCFYRRLYPQLDHLQTR